MGKPFLPGHDQWLIENHDPDMIIRDLTKMFNRHFGENRSKDVIKHRCNALGLKQNRRNFTPEQDQWLRENAPNLSVKETAKRFNEIFGMNRSESSLKARCNRTLKVYHKNQKSAVGFSVGSETTHGDYIWVKVADVPGKNSFYRNYRPKHQIVWEEHFGPIPEGKIIVFLDRNHQNCSIDNLYLVDGKVNREMSKKKWWSTNPQITLAAIKWCEHFYALKEIVRNCRE